jgi:hypothetical protein
VGAALGAGYCARLKAAATKPLPVAAWNSKSEGGPLALLGREKQIPHTIRKRRGRVRDDSYPNKDAGQECESMAAHGENYDERRRRSSSAKRNTPMAAVTTESSNSRRVKNGAARLSKTRRVIARTA